MQTREGAAAVGGCQADPQAFVGDGAQPITAYLSGPMSGLPDHNFPQFNRVATLLREAGWTVYNPAENFNGDVTLDRATYMAADFQHLLDVAATQGSRRIVLLPGWEKSRGAKAELVMAQELALEVMDWDPAASWVIAHQEPSAATEIRITDPKTGGQKGQKDAQLSYLPFEALAEISKVYQYGAKKYARDNWKKGYAWSLNFDAAMRHLFAFWEGEDFDPESQLPHVAHAAWHCLTLLWFAKHYRDGDDRHASTVLKT